ncbi:MAG TPA: cytochrome c oxidase subunit 3 family protein [Rhodothermales bacterium]|nr:cytochrome c oxidase subunit 3 family protein [Rhodothermales bacterium]
MATATPQIVDDVHAGPHHPSHLQHHFVSSQQQFEASKLGIWLFLMTEILLFSGLFVAYTVFRTWYPESFDAASATLDASLGGLNTIVLLASSFTVALSIHMAQRDNQRAVFINLVITVILGAAFMVIKGIEYTAKFEGGAYPGGFFDPHGHHYGHLANVPYAAQFFSVYFLMTGLHGVHVLVGMGIITWMAIRTHRGEFSSSYYTPIEITGLYWHLVDIIWIFLFPLLYLI